MHAGDVSPLLLVNPASNYWIAPHTSEIYSSIHHSNVIVVEINVRLDVQEANSANIHAIIVCEHFEEECGVARWIKAILIPKPTNSTHLCRIDVVLLCDLVGEDNSSNVPLMWCYSMAYFI